ncbi:MAG TPA: F0F1 ATP synthase subunit gamma [Alphaproteobacteria bacterium]|nr:F0F1 ATP synthase subunit gamma [Alphaproteobacteria bacterium]
MPSLKDLRNRIGTVKSTRKITRAMQLVAASKLKRAQEAAEAARPYADKMAAVLANLAAGQTNNPGAPLLLAGTGKTDRHLLVVCTAERGLCGAFNTNIAKLARSHIEQLKRQGKQVKVLCVGKKGRDQIKRQHADTLLDTIEFAGLKRIGFAQAQSVSRRVLDLFNAGEVDVVTLFYSRFKNVISQQPTAHQLIPAKIAEGTKPADLKGASYEYEPEEEAILEDLLPRNVTVQIFRALLENAASEQGARMAAMDNATRNAGEVIDALTLKYNRSRQAQITKELIEIISGAEAL